MSEYGHIAHAQCVCAQNELVLKNFTRWKMVVIKHFLMWNIVIAILFTHLLLELLYFLFFSLTLFARLVSVCPLAIAVCMSAC